MDLDMQVFQIWKTSGLEDFQRTSRKSSKRLPGSLLTESSPMSPFHNRSERFGKFLCLIFFHLVFNQMVLIFYLNMFSDLGLIYMFFRSGSDFGRPMGSLLGSLLKYNALEDLQEVFQTTSKKSSGRLPGSLLTGCTSISSGV
ncbi:hypothetical protein F2Q69_00021447 [Brassica cretica]|uniref:Uncharacterized protein n=1 Tax=Brassica cretica TaxID=69181 RepID=A0A8S9QCF6_BRACR|nr:hypothetical protein F2Q69_00021447 [Brassica cretica]